MLSGLLDKLYEVWLQLPQSWRQPTAWFLRRFGLRDRILKRILPMGADGFMTLSPDTLPALRYCFQVLAKSGPVGDYYEFGLYRGYTFWYAQQCAARFGLKTMRFFGFDSFKG